MWTVVIACALYVATVVYLLQRERRIVREEVEYAKRAGFFVGFNKGYACRARGPQACACMDEELANATAEGRL